MHLQYILLGCQVLHKAFSYEGQTQCTKLWINSLLHMHYLCSITLLFYLRNPAIWVHGLQENEMHFQQLLSRVFLIRSILIWIDCVWILFFLVFFVFFLVGGGGGGGATCWKTFKVRLGERGCSLSSNTSVLCSLELGRQV